MRITLLLLYSISILSMKAQKIKYPLTEQVNHIDQYFGEQVPAPYQWLEDDNSKKTKQWIKNQNEITTDYLNQIPYRNKIKEELTNLYNYEKVTRVLKVGGYIYYLKSNGIQPQPVLYRKKENGTEELFLDPNTFSDTGTSSLGEYAFNRNGTLFAYQVSDGGSDWRKLYVIETKTKKIIEPFLQDVKFSNIVWKGKEGFYYQSYDKPKKGSILSGKTEHHKLFYHKIGDSQSKDILIFGGEKNPRRYIGASITEDQKYLIITAANATSGNELYIQDISQEGNPIIPIVSGFENSYDYVTSYQDEIYILTNLNAPNSKLIKFNVNKPQLDYWEDVIPEKDQVLEVATAGKYLLAQYIVDANTKLQQYDFKGNLLRTLELPDKGRVEVFRANSLQKDMYYSFTNYIHPLTIFQCNLETGVSEVFMKPQIDFDSKEYESKQIFYTSQDGTKIPMTITYKKGTTFGPNTPTILYGYGGFNISLLPVFSEYVAAWIKNGGVYAVANIRGGGEYGRTWHDAGVKMKKKNVFNDFIAAAEYLITQKYTSSDHLAILGGSNGGLLVGAVLTMRPDLVKVALPIVGVLDMLKYHTFTAGAGWAYDYGRADESEEMFKYLKSYSPVHNVKKGVCYPATLILTGDHDDRVVPSHSYKFAAELQTKQGCDNPVLIRVETQAGHGAGKPIRFIIEEFTDILSFTMYNFGIKKLK